MPNAKDTDIPIDFLRDRLSLNANGTATIWRTRPRSLFPDGKMGDREWLRWNSRHAGKRAGSRRNDGYWNVQVDFEERSRKILEQRIIFALEHNRWPDHDVDHENRDRAANQIENLREATSSQNAQNQSLRFNNTSGVKGVSRHKLTGKWVSQIGVDGHHMHLGLHDTFAAACEVRIAAEMVLHPFRVKPPPVDPLTFIPDGVMVTGVWKVEGKMRKVPNMDKPTATSTDTTVFTYDEVAYA